MSPTTYQTTPRSAISLTSLLFYAVLLACLMRPREASCQTLQFRYTFEDAGTTTTTNDPASALYPVPLNLVSASMGAVNLHGGANSGVQNQGHALNLSTNPIGGNLNGAFAYVSNNATLGQLGVVSNFTATLWIKMPVLETNLSNQGSRLFSLMANGIGDIGGVNTLGMQFQLNTGGGRTYPQIGIIGVVASASKVTAPIYYNWPTNVWIFLAVTYDSVSGLESIYYGTEASPAKMYVVKNIGAGTNLNFSGTASFSLGNRLSNGRSFPGWIDEARFYTGTGNAAFIESVRQSSTPVVIAGLVPDGSVLMSGTNTLSFAATSASGVNAGGVAVSVNGADVSSQLQFSPIAGGQLVTYTNLPVNPMLTTQSNLNAVIVNIRVTDAGGIVTSNRYAYDAFSPANFTWEAEDYDYAGGQYTDNPVYAFNTLTNPYFQAGGTAVIDYYDNGGAGGSPQSQVYRNISDLAATEYSLGAGTSGTAGSGAISLGELMRQKILDAFALDNSVRDVDVGNFDGLITTAGSPTPGTPNWMNYTRTYPTDTFNLYIRVAQGGTSGADTLAELTGGWGSYTQTTTSLGTFNLANTGGWEAYAWVPLKDSFGNLVQVTLGGTNTLQLTAGDASHTGAGAGGNVNFLLLTVANTNLPVITGIYPNGTNLFQPASKLAFAAASPAGFSISTNSISVKLTMTKLSGQSYTTNLTSTNGLGFTGAATSWNVTCPLVTNAAYKAVISATDVNGGPATSTVSFDTYSPAYVWEAEDYDYNNAQFIDNPQLGAYGGLSGVSGVDYHSDSGTVPNTADGGPYYRSDGISTQPDGDTVRLAYLTNGVTSYYVGWFNSGNWANYTRTYPAGAYNVFLRASDGNATTGSATLAQVTAGVGTADQTLTNLGTFSISPTGGWQTYGVYALKDSSGNLAKVTLSGVTTLRLTSAGNLNVNFLMLAPADPNLPAISGSFPDGAKIFNSTNTFAYTVTSPLGVASNNIVVSVNGATVTNLVFSGSAANWAISYPHLQPNMNYNVVVTATDAGGNVIVRKDKFDTFSPANYTWEGEDFDFNGGQFFDNPQTNAYLGVSSLTNVDYLDINTAGGTHWTAYRPDGMETEVNGDAVRPQYNGTGFTDYSVGYYSTNEWMNFTRNYPAGTYYVYGRMATAGGATSYASLSRVTSGWGTPAQTTNYLGTFAVTTNSAWETYSFYPLTDAAGNLVAVTFDGATNTLQVGKLTGPDINVNFFTLVPPFKLGAVPSAGGVTISFPSQAGFHYQVQYKTSLADATWTALGAPVAGDNSVKAIPYSTAGTGARYYRVQVQ